ncbi:hypothetical protein [Streptomyces sp. NPDC005374]|uniref:hypothetical protein n=1 Tax=Streptomyces sp. NPDC005374 TaxID=3364713 RepID=UPI0036B23977
MSNYTPDGTADADAAFGAIAFQPVTGTYVTDSIEADAYFDEDQNVDVRPESQMFNTPLKSRQALYDWATGRAHGRLAMRHRDQLLSVGLLGTMSLIALAWLLFQGDRKPAVISALCIAAAAAFLSAQASRTRDAP